MYDGVCAPIACGGQSFNFLELVLSFYLWKESNSGHWADAQTALPAELRQQTPEFILCDIQAKKC